MSKKKAAKKKPIDCSKRPDDKTPCSDTKIVRQPCDKHKSNAQRYEQAQPEQFGDIHGRMKFLMEMCHKYHSEGIPTMVWHAVFDLETEVKNYEPINPPFGRRLVKMGSRHKALDASSGRPSGQG
jgi:hypothetical protein